MTISTRIALGVSAAVLSLSLALAPAAFAQDAMKKDDGMKKDGMMKKDDGMKKDGMMKKDDGMKKDDTMKKDDMKK
jgi:pentapeptide MXKDX repeat protein